MPISEAVRRLPPETIYVRPDMDRYARVSRRIMQALNNLAPVIEQVSIDETYLDVSGLERLLGSPSVIGRRAKTLIQEAVGLTASVGIGPNRLIAKLASDSHKPDGLTIVRLDAVGAFLDPLPYLARHARRSGLVVTLKIRFFAVSRSIRARARWRCRAQMIGCCSRPPGNCSRPGAGPKAGQTGRYG